MFLLLYLTMDKIYITFLTLTTGDQHCHLIQCTLGLWVATPSRITICSAMFAQYTGRSLSPGYYTPVMLGGVSRPQLTEAGLVRREVRRGFCSPDLINIDNLVSDRDDKLFYSILKNKHHVFHQLLPPERSDCGYILRPRRHKISLTKKTQLDEQNFFTDLSIKTYTELSLIFIVLLIFRPRSHIYVRDVLKPCLDSFLINEYR